MMTIADLLPPENVCLDLLTPSSDQAIEQVANLLRSDPDVVDWGKLYATLRLATPCAAERGCNFGICIPHARTSAVSGMVMSVGRSDDGILFPGCPHVIRYVFCIGVPATLDTDYLRIVGLLARILKNPETEAQLRDAPTPAEFVETLSRLEAKL